MSKDPSERTWYVPFDPETGEVDADEIAQVAVDVSTVLRMVGGTAQCIADKEEILAPPRHEGGEPIRTGLYQCVGMWWVWHPYAPSARREEPQERVQQQQPRQQGQNGGQRRRRRRGRGGGGGQPPPPVRAVPDEPAAGAAFENQPEPEPQEPEVLPAEELEDERDADEFVPLTDAVKRDLAAEGVPVE